MDDPREGGRGGLSHGALTQCLEAILEPPAGLAARAPRTLVAKKEARQLRGEAGGHRFRVCRSRRGGPVADPSIAMRLLKTGFESSAGPQPGLPNVRPRHCSRVPTVLRVRCA